MSEQWLEELQEKVANCWEWHCPPCRRSATPSPTSRRLGKLAHPAVQEIVGGKEDGETVWSGFNFDVLEFLKDFEPEAVAVNTRQHIHPSEMTFEGKFRGKGVFLHLCLEPPEDAEATEIVDLRGDGGPVVRDKE
jgi:hypothetical protein